jgi:hypothetical protein
MNIANKKVKDFLTGKKKGHYIDVATVILNPATTQPDSSHCLKADCCILTARVMINGRQYYSRL